MISSFDKEALFSLIKDLYSAIGIRISIFDDAFNLVTEYPTEAPSICRLVRTTEEGLRACRECDRAAFERAKKLKAPHTYKCHIGITEAIAPIHLDSETLGYALFAHMLPEENVNESLDEICMLCQRFNLDKYEVQKAAKELKTHSTEKISASIHLLEAIASYLQIKKIANWKTEEFSVQLRLFIDANLDKDLTSAVLCNHFYISRTKLYHLSLKAFNMGVSEYILSRRIEKAKQLLKTEKVSIADTAKRVGFSDYNYFCKIFKKVTGVTPSKYAKTDKKDSES